MAKRKKHKRTNNDLQRSTKHTHKTKDRVTRTPLKIGRVISPSHICVGCCFLFCPFSFGYCVVCCEFEFVVSSNPVHSESYSSSVPDHCVVCPPSTYGFRLPLWYPQTRLVQLSEARTQNHRSWSFFCSVIFIERCFFLYWWNCWFTKGCRGRDRMVVTTAYAISVYHYKRCEFESRSREVFSIQHYMIKFVSDFQQVCGFLRVLRVLRFPPPI